MPCKHSKVIRIKNKRGSKRKEKKFLCAYCGEQVYAKKKATKIAVS